MIEDPNTPVEAQFVKGGGYSEQLAAAHPVERQQIQDPSDPPDPPDHIPPCPRCSYISVGQGALVVAAMLLGPLFFVCLFRGNFERTQLYWRLSDSIGHVGITALIFSMMAFLLVVVCCLRLVCLRLARRLDRRRTTKGQPGTEE